MAFTKLFLAGVLPQVRETCFYQPTSFRGRTLKHRDQGTESIGRGLWGSIDLADRLLLPCASRLEPFPFGADPSRRVVSGHSEIFAGPGFFTFCTECPNEAGGRR